MLRRWLHSFIEENVGQSLHRRTLNKLVEEAAVEFKGRLLELGAGAGRYSSLYSRAAEVVRTDQIAQPALEIAAADARALDFHDSSFDVVVAFEVFEYFIETTAALDEVLRVLKPGGIFYFSVPFLCPVHGTGRALDSGSDLVRYTRAGWQNLLEERFASCAIKSFGGRGAALLDLFAAPYRSAGHPLMRLAISGALLLTRCVVTSKVCAQGEGRYPTGYFVKCKKA